MGPAAAWRVAPLQMCPFRWQQVDRAGKRAPAHHRPSCLLCQQFLSTLRERRTSQTITGRLLLEGVLSSIHSLDEHKRHIV